MAGVSNLFDKVRRKYDGAMSIVAFLASITLLIIGCILFAEDTRTSYLGLQEIQAYYGLALSIWPITFWAESLVPQVGQIVFFYIFFTDMRRNWPAAAIAFLLLVIDFYADVYHRTMGTISISPDMIERTLVGGIFTLGFFTIGAELFISVGFGLAMTLMSPAIRNFKILVSEQKGAISSGPSPRPSQRPSQPRQPQQPRRTPPPPGQPQRSGVNLQDLTGE